MVGNISCIKYSLNIFQKIVVRIGYLAPGSGLLYVSGSNVVIIAEKTVQTHLEANVFSNSGSIIKLPLTTYVEAKLTVWGLLRGVEHFYVRGQTELKQTGGASCSSRSSPAARYQFTTCTVVDTGKLTLEDADYTSDDGTSLISSYVHIQHSGSIQVTKSGSLSTFLFELEKSGRVYGDSLSYTANSGPGAGNTNNAGSGAGHGGAGGAGKGCAISSGGGAYDDAYLPVLGGSGGGSCSHGRSGGTGGSAIRIVSLNALYIEGRITSIGGSGSGGGGGGSGGAIWVDSDVIEGWGLIQANGGSASSDCQGCFYSSCCCYHDGGGGGGGRIRTFSSNHTHIVVHKQRYVSGGPGAGDNGASGSLVDYHGNKCSGHGTMSNGVCTCRSGYVGSDCQFVCDTGSVCNNHGVCSQSGACTCEKGYGGQGCDVQCHRNTSCSGHGSCALCGNCVCDPCFHGNDCSNMCSGQGQCVADQCQCDACHLGDFCESECNGHGKCQGGVCVCDANWYGSKCTSRGCPTSDLTRDCSAHGVCNAYTGVCYCSPGWMGMLMLIMLT